MTEPMPTVVALVTNLFFATRLTETARALGVTVLVVKPEEAVRRCRESSPGLIVLDLEEPPDPRSLILELKADPNTSGIRTIGLYPHVRRDLRDSALAAGLDAVMPRSAFTAKLADLLRGVSPTAS